jgi:hypothetical protein
MWPVKRAHGIKDAFCDVALVVERKLHTHRRLVAINWWSIHPVPQTDRAARQIKEVQAEGEEQDAGDRQDPDRCELDQRSKRV